MTNRAIDILKQHFGATNLNLVGYSGGGAMALLSASRREDVVRLVTVAGNLDHQAWTRFQGYSALDGSLNPAEHVAQFQHIQQWHLAGAEDRNIPPILTKQFISRFSENHRPYIQTVPDFTHSCCWVQAWPILWEQIVLSSRMSPEKASKFGQ